jgi:hemerythrin superfamily protein
MKDDDAILILVTDHREVNAKFEEFFALEEGSWTKKKQLADEICEVLTLHTQIEEEVFYPAARAEIDDDSLMDEALVEHAGAKELIAQISAMQPDEDLYDAKVKVLSEQITHHVREEESDMFPKVRETKLDLVALGEALRKRKQELQMAET